MTLIPIDTLRSDSAISLFILPLIDGIPLLVNSDECGAQEKKEMEAIKPMLMNFIKLIFEII